MIEALLVYYCEAYIMANYVGPLLHEAGLWRASQSFTSSPRAVPAVETITSITTTRKHS